MKLLLVCVAVMACQLGCAMGENARDTMEKVQAGVEAGQAILEVMGDEKFSENFKKVGKIAGKLAPFLGALGPAVSLITLFLPESPSPEMQLMQKEFAKIDANFDKVFDQFGEVKNLIKETSLKNQYSTYEHVILSLSEKLQKFLSASTQDAPVYKRSFVNEYKTSYAGATDKLWRGMMEDTVLSDNIPKTAMSYTNNHRRRTQNLMKGVLNLILQGVKVQLSYYKAEGMDLDYNVKKGYWEDKVKQLLNHMQSVDGQVKGKWYSQTGTDIDVKLPEYHGWRNSDFANALYNFLKDKYDWRDWHVVAYNELHGGDKHWVKWCSGYNRFRKNGRNLVVASVDKTKGAINKGHAQGLLSRTSTRYCRRGFWGSRSCRDRGAKDVYQNHLASEFKNGCTYASAGVIQKNADVQHRAPSNRLVTVDNNKFKLHAFG